MVLLLGDALSAPSSDEEGADVAGEASEEVAAPLDESVAASWPGAWLVAAGPFVGSAGASADKGAEFPSAGVAAPAPGAPSLDGVEGVASLAASGDAVPLVTTGSGVADAAGVGSAAPGVCSPSEGATGASAVGGVLSVELLTVGEELLKFGESSVFGSPVGIEALALSLGAAAASGALTLPAPSGAVVLEAGAAAEGSALTSPAGCAPPSVEGAVDGVDSALGAASVAVGSFDGEADSVVCAPGVDASLKGVVAEEAKGSLLPSETAVSLTWPAAVASGVVAVVSGASMGLV